MSPSFSDVRAGLGRRADDLRFRARAGLAAARRPDLSVDGAKLVVGTGRSGTTWLMEILGTDPSTLPVFEPIHGWRTPASQLDSINGFHALHRGDLHPELEAYLVRVFRGRMLNRWTVRDASVAQILHAERVVAKAIRMCGAVGWFEERFPTVPVVAVVRHPCAVVASMARADGRWELPASMLRAYAARALDLDADELLRGQEADDIVRFATLWAIDNASLLRHSDPAHTLVVGFEELVSDPRPNLERVLEHLDLRLDLDRIDLARASSTTVRTGQVPAGDRLGRWRDQLAPAQIDRVIEIVHAAGITTIDADPVPDMEAFRIRRAHD